MKAAHVGGCVMAENPIPRWPEGTGGPRALVECEDPAIQDGLTRVLAERGYQVASCSGPQARAAHECPLVEHGECGLVHDADVVVHALDASDPGNRAILSSIREWSPDVPVIVEVSAHTSHPTEVAEGCEPVAYPMTGASVVDAVQRVTHR